MTIVFFRIVEAVFTGILQQFFFHLFFERDKDNIDNIDNENENENENNQDIEHQ
jgi:hypothetical protein